MRSFADGGELDILSAPGFLLLSFELRHERRVGTGLPFWILAMSDASKTAPAALRQPSTKPYPSWSDLLTQVTQDKPNYRTVQAPPAREWRDVVASLIADRR